MQDACMFIAAHLYVLTHVSGVSGYSLTHTHSLTHSLTMALGLSGASRAAVSEPRARGPSVESGIGAGPLGLHPMPPRPRGYRRAGWLTARQLNWVSREPSWAGVQQHH